MKKNTINILLILFIVSCTVKEDKHKTTSNCISVCEQNEKHALKVDSILLDLNKKYDLRYHPYKDMQKISQFYPLKKRIYNNDIKLNFEFRKYYDSHTKNEIIICYDDSGHYYGIPHIGPGGLFTYLENTQKKSSLEIELNNASEYFYKEKKYNTDKRYASFLTASEAGIILKLITRTIITGQSSFNIKKIMLSDSTMVFDMLNKCRIKCKEKNNHEGQVKADANMKYFQKCFKNIGSLNSLTDYYVLPFHNLIYEIHYASYPEVDSNFVKINYFNHECYFDMIY